MGGDMGSGDMGVRGVKGSLGRGDDGRPMPGNGGARGRLLRVELRVEAVEGDLGGLAVDEGGRREWLVRAEDAESEREWDGGGSIMMFMAGSGESGNGRRAMATGNRAESDGPMFSVYGT